MEFPGSYVFETPFGGKRGDTSLPTVSLIRHPLITVEAALRLYGHPHLLKVAEAIYADRTRLLHAGVGPN